MSPPASDDETVAAVAARLEEAFGLVWDANRQDHVNWWHVAQVAVSTLLDATASSETP